MESQAHLVLVVHQEHLEVVEVVAQVEALEHVAHLVHQAHLEVLESQAHLEALEALVLVALLVLVQPFQIQLMRHLGTVLLMWLRARMLFMIK